MRKLDELVQLYTIKHDRKIKKICAPLRYLEIPHFSYIRIEPDGSFGTLANDPEETHIYYAENHYVKNPYFVHPSFHQAGYLLTTIAPNNSELTVHLFKRLKMCHLLAILRKLNGALEAFVFIPYAETMENRSAEFFTKLPLFEEFASYFKREANPLIESMMHEGFNLKSFKGKAFDQADPYLPLLGANANAVQFEKAIFPLSTRERQCLELFKHGKSAQATAAELGLSQRTVEHYFDNIKNKLNCRSKWDLLEQ